MPDVTGSFALQLPTPAISAAGLLSLTVGTTVASPYVTAGDVRESAAPDGDYSGTCAELTDEQLGRAVQRAQELVDATTGFAYSSANVPSLVRGVVIALATYYGTLMYRKGKELGQFHPVYLAYQDASAVLKQVKDGLLNTTPVADTNPVPVRSRPRIFNPSGQQGATMFHLSDVGLRKVSGFGTEGPTLDPEILFWQSDE